MIYLIPLIMVIFVIGDSRADGLIQRKSGVAWISSIKIDKNFLYGFHFPNWIRRYSSNGLLIMIWYNIAGVSLSTIYFMIIFIAILWGIWKINYLATITN